MEKYKIGVVGNGFVGNALYENFKQNYPSKVYDVLKDRSPHSLEEVLQMDIIFVCLPTPMKSAEGAECNLSIIDNFFSSIPKNHHSLFVIKSTVPIGTTKRLKKNRPDIKIVHNPEFLTARNASEDFKNSYRNVIGGDAIESLPLYNLLSDMFPNSSIQIVSSDESEMIKYFCNSFLATKVAFFNLVYDLCEKMGADYLNVSSGIASDKRIGESHIKVPGIDGDRGFGGTCFPKDINSLISIYKDAGLDTELFKVVWEYNKKIRKDWDWAQNKSAVLKE